jgi:AcrR family transcriptional regulator
MEQEILAAAIRVFAKKGYHGSSIRDITNESGVSKALFYHYFESKKDLLVIFAKKRLEDYFPLAEGMKGIKDPHERLIFLVDFVLDELKTQTEKLRFINMLFLTEEGSQAIHEAMKKYEEQFAEIFQMERQLFLDLGFSDPDMEAVYMRSLLQGISLEYMLSSAEYPLEGIREKLLSKYKEIKK